MRVSIIIPVYNAERYVGEAVASALDQPETGEVLLIEDGSADGSLGVCERLAAEHEKVRLLRHPGGANRGAGESRNAGVRAARCEFVAFLDADDYYLPGRFAATAAALARDAAADGVYDAVGTDYETERMRRWWEERGGEDVTTVRGGAVAPERLFEVLVGARQGWFHTNGIVVRRELFDRTGEFNPALRMCQDTEMWLRMAAAGRLVAGSLDRPVAMRRLHGENRIFRDARVHDGYRMMMYRGLVRWGRGRLRAEQREAVVRTLLWHVRRAGERKGAAGRLLGSLGWAARLAWSDPGVVRSPSYRLLLLSAAGLSGRKGQVKRWLGRVAGRGAEG